MKAYAFAIVVHSDEPEPELWETLRASLPDDEVEFLSGGLEIPANPDGYDVEPVDMRVRCKLCGKGANAATAHLYQDAWAGECPYS